MVDYLRAVEVDVSGFDADAARIEDGIGDIARFQGTHAPQFVIAGDEQVTGTSVGQTGLSLAASGRRIARSALAAESSALLLDAQLGAGGEVTDGLLETGFVILIASVHTVVESVAEHGSIDTVAVAAAELIGQTDSLGLAHGRIFVGSVLAVVVFIADFRLRNAQEVGAAEFARRTAEQGAHVARLVRSVAAVVVSVAAPQERRALAVVAFEVFRRAGRVAVVHFIRAVGAVHVAVAAPFHVDAELGAGALEFPLAARRVAVDFITAIHTNQHFNQNQNRNSTSINSIIP